MTNCYIFLNSKGDQQMEPIKKNQLVLVCMIICIIWPFLFFSCSQTQLQGHGGAMLFSEEDAAALDLGQLPKTDWHGYVSRTFAPKRGVSSKGPRIQFMRPSVTLAAAGPTIETQSPTELIVAFEESPSGNPVDMSTLEVVGRKGFFRKTLTDNLRPYIVGSQIKATDINIPHGKFHLQISIADTAGVKTTENYLLVVR